MKVGLYLTPQGDLETARDVVRRAEASGFDSVWLPHGLGRDSLLLLTLYGAATTRLGLGSGVLPIHPRHPVALAQEALTLSGVTGGRFRLGIGISHGSVMGPAFGITIRDPLETMREYVAALRAAYRGDGARFEGRRHGFRSILTLPDAPAAPPIYLGALSPRMIELAGEIADGVIFWLCPPGYIRDVAMPALERGRRRAGASLDGFEVVAAVPVAATERRRDADAVFREELVRYLGLPFYRAMFELSGHGADVRRFDETGCVGDALASAVGRVGDAADLDAYVTCYRAAGVTLPAIRPIGWPASAWCRPTIDAVHA